MSEDKQYSRFEGLTTKNALFVSGLVIAPAVTYASTLSHGLMLAGVFTAVTFLSLAISSFVPRNIVYAIRIILYTFIASMVYVPVYMIVNRFFPSQLAEMGIFAPLMITNSFIISKSELKFFRESRSRMFSDIVFYIIGYDGAVIIYSAVRELLSTGSLMGKMYGIPTVMPAFSTTFGGLILLGFCAALFRAILYAFGSKKE